MHGLREYSVLRASSVGVSARGVQERWTLFGFIIWVVGLVGSVREEGWFIWRVFGTCFHFCFCLVSV